MTIGWLKIRWHCVVLVDEHCLLFTAAFNLDFIIDVVIEIANVDASPQVIPCHKDYCNSFFTSSISTSAP